MHCFALSRTCRFLLNRNRLCYRTVREIVAGADLPNEAHYLVDDGGKRISFWNDVPLNLSGDEVTACAEIPRNTVAKMEVIKEMKHHPIMQDTRKNLVDGKKELRYYAQFPYFNYGFLPQTWQQNIQPEEGLLGDNDPLDILDVSSSVRKLGEVFRAKVLGSFCLIDQGEIDWKVLIIDPEQSRTSKIDSLEGLERQQPGRIQAIKGWFKLIKTFDGKKPNSIAHNEKLFSKDATVKLIAGMHKEWQKLHTSPDPQRANRRAKFVF